MFWYENSCQYYPSIPQVLSHTLWYVQDCGFVEQQNGPWVQFPSSAEGRFHTSRTSDANMRPKTRPSLVYIMARHQVNIWTEPMPACCWLNQWEQFFLKFYSELNISIDENAFENVVWKTVANLAPAHGGSLIDNSTKPLVMQTCPSVVRSINGCV